MISFLCLRDSWFDFMVLDSFANLRKTTMTLEISDWPSVGPHETAQQTLDGFL